MQFDTNKILIENSNIFLFSKKKKEKKKKRKEKKEEEVCVHLCELVCLD